MATGSYVVNPATALPYSHIKGPMLYFAGGLVGGLALGVGGVVLGALLSRRLRRRDDVAAALGAPVRLSVGPLRGTPLAAVRYRGRPPKRKARHEAGRRVPARFGAGKFPGPGQPCRRGR